ncbi:MAG TPA: histidine phosphatase family protein, partial [Chromatiales bacterium]|nr:histidine phosphatase family protein [Chromatiales bacterium]
MLELTLIRHANAQTNSVSGNDIDRTLSAKGRADTARVGQRL